VSIDRVIAITAVAVGAMLALVSARAALRDLKTGVVAGRVNGFRRETRPAIFRFAIAATLLAAILGLLMLIVGVARLLSH
jgi:hypothetical protein